MDLILFDQPSSVCVREVVRGFTVECFFVNRHTCCKSPVGRDEIRRCWEGDGQLLGLDLSSA